MINVKLNHVEMDNIWMEDVIVKMDLYLKMENVNKMLNVKVVGL